MATAFSCLEFEHSSRKIACGKTEKGLKILSELNTNTHEKGIAVMKKMRNEGEFTEKPLLYQKK